MGQDVSDEVCATVNSRCTADLPNDVATRAARVIDEADRAIGCRRSECGSSLKDEDGIGIV